MPGPRNGIDRVISTAIFEPRGLSTYREAAAIFRLGRTKGISLSTIDALIASIALENRAAVFTLDKDFSLIARLTNLPLYRHGHV